jgi:hypothetical protein
MRPGVAPWTKPGPRPTFPYEPTMWARVIAWIFGDEP